MDDDILQEFLAESWENLSRLDNEIVRLEKEPKNADLLASIFRTIHTIKGTCGFIGLTGLGGVAHAAENVLGQMHIQTLAATPTSISVVLEAIDEI
ncbi:MAG: Hpt domain-containing protein, partial [Planctomycetaceae bacterium]